MTDDNVPLQTKIAIMETKLENVHTNFEHLENKNTTSYISLCNKIETLHNDMQRLHRYINEKNEKLSEKIDTQWKSSMTAQQNMIERLHANEKWRWTVIGGLMAVSYLLSKVNLLEIFTR